MKSSYTLAVPLFSIKNGTLPVSTASRFSSISESVSVPLDYDPSVSQEINLITSVNEQEKYFDLRDELLKKPFAFIFCKKKIQKIEKEIDRLNMQIYQLGRKEYFNENHFKKVMCSVDETIKKYAHFLKK